MVRKHRPMTDWVVVKMRTDFIDKKLVKEGDRYVEKTEGGIFIPTLDKDNVDVSYDPHTGQRIEQYRAKVGYSEEEIKHKKSGGMEGHVVTIGPDAFWRYGGNQLEDGSYRINAGDLVSFVKYSAMDKLDFRSGEDFYVMVKDEDIVMVWGEE